MKKIRIGHLGVSHDHSQAVLECVLRYPDVFEFVGLAEPSKAHYDEKIANNKFYKSLPIMSVEELIAQKSDAMLIEGYELENLDAAELCIQNGIHIHFDKPAGADLAQFKRILDMAKEKNLVVHMGYMYRYNHAVQYCMDRIADGTLGEVYQVDAFMDTCHDPEKRAWMHEFPAGNMFFLGCHMVDFVYMMLGKPKAVYPFNRHTGFDGVDVADHGCAVLDYGNAVSTVRATSTQVNGFGRRQLVVCGTKGTIEIKPLEVNYRDSSIIQSDLYLSTKEMVGPDIYRNICKKIDLKPMIGRYDDMMMAFAAYVRGEKKNPYDYDYEYGLQEVVLAACQE
ncbi:MAG: Gfo/Idh/MocA family oxidoreductase [Clostridia bacterium]|nr:Gfo/Idh/MocA family oxidoreductase [Clostridia bacterium]